MASISVDRSGVCHECAARVDAENKQMHVEWHIDQYQRLTDLREVLRTVTASVNTQEAVREVEERWAESPWGNLP